MWPEVLETSLLDLWSGFGDLWSLRGHGLVSEYVHKCKSE